MKPPTRILVPTDFSEASQRAAEMAIMVAERFGAELQLLHVIEPQVMAYAGVPFAPVVNFVAEAEQAARHALTNEEERLRQRITVHSSVRMGAAWSEIIEEAKERDCGMIVMSTHGHRGLARALIGSTAEKVVRVAPVPVLTLHGGTKEA